MIRTPVGKFCGFVAVNRDPQRRQDVHGQRDTVRRGPKVRAVHRLLRRAINIVRAVQFVVGVVRVPRRGHQLRHTGDPHEVHQHCAGAQGGGIADENSPVSYTSARATGAGTQSSSNLSITFRRRHQHLRHHAAAARRLPADSNVCCAAPPKLAKCFCNQRIADCWSSSPLLAAAPSSSCSSARKPSAPRR